MITYVYSYKKDNEDVTFLSGSDRQNGIFIIPVGSKARNYANDEEQGLKLAPEIVPEIKINNVSATKYVCDDEASQGCGLVAVYEHPFFCDGTMTLADNSPIEDKDDQQDDQDNQDNQDDQD